MQNPQIWGVGVAFSPIAGRGGRLTPALAPGRENHPALGRKAVPPPCVPLRDAAGISIPSDSPIPARMEGEGLARDVPQRRGAGGCKSRSQKKPLRGRQGSHNVPTHPDPHPAPYTPKNPPSCPCRKTLDGIKVGWDHPGSPQQKAGCCRAVLPPGKGLQPSTRRGCHPPATLGALCTGGSALPARTKTAADSGRPCPGTEEAGRAGTLRQRRCSLRGSFAALSPCRGPTAPVEIPYSQEQGKHSGWDRHGLKPLQNMHFSWEKTYLPTPGPSNQRLREI